MMRFKNHKRGFTLVEVMLSMMIMGLALSPIFILFSMIMQRVNRSSRAYDAVLLCKNFLQEAHQKQEPEAQSFSLEKKEIDFDVTLTYSLDKGVDQKSVFGSLQGLHRETVTATWLETGEKKEEQLVSFVYKKPEQKKS
jgi:prepilin-type N-terminal cleavage/methylation domain-containing protein